MKLSHLIEAVTEEDMQKFLQWQKDCRLEAPDCQFVGSAGVGSQAVDWTSKNNRCVGDWDYKTMSGQVYRLGA